MEKRIRKFLPVEGNIRLVSITEKQYDDMRILVGSKTIKEAAFGTERLIIILKITVTKYSEKIEFELAKVTQLCGQNIRRKQFVINSLIKYFSNEKYTESEEQYRDNVYIDNEQVGRNYFKVIRISNIEDILKLIKVGKATLLSQYIKDRLAAFDCENHLSHIENIRSNEKLNSACTLKNGLYEDFEE